MRRQPRQYQADKRKRYLCIAAKNLLAPARIGVMLPCAKKFIMGLDLERTQTSRLAAMTTSLTIQQAAAATGLTAHTLRYYERIGLLDPVARQDNKHRLYREEDILWIGFLLKLRMTGLPVRDMLRYAELRRLGNSPESVSARKALLEQHTHTVEKTLAELQSNLSILHKKIAMYDALEADLPKPVLTQPPLPEDASHDHPKHVNPRNSNRNAPTGR